MQSTTYLGGHREHSHVKHSVNGNRAWSQAQLAEPLAPLCSRW